jgi:2-polyprenyl-3-methyl-5-hydroxy-6-metoxy-1,4-benzoquinol methylase
MGDPERPYFFESEKPDAYFKCERGEMLHLVPESVRKALDVGCGTGAFGRLLKERKPVEVWGIELNGEVAEEAASHLDRVLVGSFPSSIELPVEYFDCIIFNDVLEHMIDPWAALGAAKRYLTKQGWVIASIPNIRYLPILYRLLVRGEWKYTPTGVLDKTHLRFFTKKSMIEMFNDAGYEILQIEGIYPYPKWYITALELLTWGFVKEAKYIDYAILSRVKVA